MAAQMMWVSVDGVRYDVSEFVKRHPGGSELLESYVGLDASDVFTEFHGPAARVLLKALPVIAHDGKPAEQETPLQRDVRILRKELMAEGRFIASPVFYAGKVAELAGLTIAASYLLASGWWFAAAFLMGLMFQQAGWLAHDIAHNQVTRRYRSALLFLTAGVCQGFTPVWWIPKHMKHHALPNAIHEETGDPVDEDFDTAPLLYWTERVRRRPHHLAAGRRVQPAARRAAASAERDCRLLPAHRGRGGRGRHPACLTGLSSPHERARLHRAGDPLAGAAPAGAPSQHVHPGALRPVLPGILLLAAAVLLQVHLGLPEPAEGGALQGLGPGGWVGGGGRCRVHWAGPARGEGGEGGGSSCSSGRRLRAIQGPDPPRA
jgi:hypothetical protein